MGEKGQPGSRNHHREWSASVWRGSLTELTDASQTALDEIERLTSPVLESSPVKLDFIGSDQEFGTLSALDEVTRELDPAEISGFHFCAMCSNDSKVEIVGGGNHGLQVRARGTELFAIGMTGTLESRLSGGYIAGRRAARVPLGAWEVVVGALILLSALGLGLFCLSRGLGIAVAGLLALTAVGVLVQVAADTVLARRSGRRPPAFVVVEEGKQFPDKAENDGPLWQAKAWLDRHPGTGVGLVLVAGALLGRLAQEISF